MDTTVLFYGILFITLIWSVINSTFFAWIAKNKSILWVAIYRSIFISILLLPLLFFSDFTQVTYSFLIACIILWFIWAAWFFFQLKANKYLPMWIVGALMNLNNIWILIFSYYIFWENLSLLWYIWATILLLSLWWLWIFKSKTTTQEYNYKKWLFFIILRIFTLIFWISGFIYFSREVDKYFAIYLSEFTVLLGFIPFIIHHIKTSKEDIFHIFKWSEVYRFFLMCTFPAFFSFGLFYASTIGNPSIVTLTLSTSSIFIALVSWLFYKEKLNTLQWSMIILSVVGLILINI